MGSLVILLTLVISTNSIFVPKTMTDFSLVMLQLKTKTVQRHVQYDSHDASP